MVRMETDTNGSAGYEGLGLVRLRAQSAGADPDGIRKTRLLEHVDVGRLFMDGRAFIEISLSIQYRYFERNERFESVPVPESM